MLMKQHHFRAWLKPERKMYHVLEIRYLHNIFMEVNEKNESTDDLLAYVKLEREQDYSIEVKPDNANFIIHHKPILSRYIELMLYSGLRDMKNKEICEADVVEVNLDGEVLQREVFFDTGSFWINGKDGGKLILLGEIHEKVSIVGNTYDNPELISNLFQRI